MCSLPEWPATYRLNIVDEQHNVLLTHGAGTVELQVSATRWRNGELLHALQEQLPQEDFNKLLPTPYIDYFSKVENLALRLHDQAQQQKPQLFALINSVRETAVTEVEKDILAQAPGLSKTHVEEMAATLSQNERQRLHQDKSLPPHQQWEAGQYLNAIRAARAREGIYLDAPHNPDSIALMLYALEQLPGWPGARIEVYDDSNSGPLLGSIGSEPNSVRHILIRRGQQYIAQDTQGADLHLPGDLFSTLERSLGEPLRQALVSRSSAHSLKAAVQRRSLSLIAQHPPRRASAAAQTLSQTNDAALDTLFAEPSPPQGMTLRADGIYQAPPLPDGSYPCYILDQQHYYRVKSDDLGWQLIDARSPFRAYRPYVRRTTPGGWEIDPAKGALMGGMPEVPAPRGAPMDSSDEFESARSSSDYESAEEGAVKVLYTPHELAHMRSERSYQYSQNYRRIYDRANNGRYPLRNEQGRALRIKRLQNFGKSLTSPTLFSKQLVLPYIQWEGFENVARLYDDKLEVVPFTAAHQKFPEEAALIGQATVMTRKPIKRGEALGVYGGELLPYYIAAFRQDPYIIDVKPFSPTPAAPPPVLSGDNIISRINTILEYEGGVPARQAASGYNVEAAVFNADVQAGAAALERFEIKVMFASEDIPAATELRWNYQYNEATVRALFGPLPNSH
ncbi:hypothetical protein LRS56_23775 [Pseudomonas poae]|nr:hypothetical protein LRS56_23775 [Pseudomonas poae]